jgi:uncharacterized secreted protein with C-terminal beta-propeller domain
VTTLTQCFIKRLSIFIALFALQFSAISAEFADRKPIYSGMWYDASRNGEGFEIRAVRDEIFLVWFNFDSTARPIWYSAQGRYQDKQINTYALFRHRFENGRINASTQVGKVLLKAVDATNITISFELGTQSGARALRPLEVAANGAEIDHSGQWFEATRPGYGLGLSEAEGVGYAAVYLYDSAGDPFWLFGARRGEKNLPYQMSYFEGSCPTCSYVPPQQRYQAEMTLAFPDANSLQLNLAVPPLVQSTFVKLPGFAIANAMTRLTPGPDALTANRSLVAFSDAAALKNYLVNAITLTPTSYPVITFSASPPPTPTAFSALNTIVSGVDESSSLRTDGNMVYALDADKQLLRLFRYQNSALVQVAERELRNKITNATLNKQASGTLLFGEQVITVRGTQAVYSNPGWRGVPFQTGWKNGRTAVEFLSRATLTGASETLEIDGHLMAARRAGGKIYLVTRSYTEPDPSLWAVGTTAEARTQALSSLPLSSMLPQLRINGVASTALNPSAIYLPPPGAQSETAELIIVTEIDLNKALSTPGTVRSIAMAGQLSAFYLSEDTLYLATNRFNYSQPAIASLVARGSFMSTEIHRFKLAPEGLVFAGSGAVEGYLDRDFERAPLRMNQKGDALQIVTVSDTQWGSLGRNRLSVLGTSSVNSRLLKTISFIPNASDPRPIGKPNEQLFGTRFIGDRLYAVTFLRTDPLYIIDLKDNTRPKITGELEIPGFSDYLHPIGEGYLLGVGKDAYVQASNNTAWYQGILLSLFDVRDPSSPKQLAKLVVGQRGTESALFRTHQALSVRSFGDRTSIAFPAAVYEGLSPEAVLAQPFSSAPFRYSGLLQFDIHTGAQAAISQSPAISIPDFGSNTQLAASAASNDARGLYLNDLRVYLENGRIWYQRGMETLGPL